MGFISVCIELRWSHLADGPEMLFETVCIVSQCAALSAMHDLSTIQNDGVIGKGQDFLSFLLDDDH